MYCNTFHDRSLEYDDIWSTDEFYKGKDAYGVLEVPRSADQKQIKSAYRKLVGKWHPDKFPDDEVAKAAGGRRMEARGDLN